MLKLFKQCKYLVFCSLYDIILTRLIRVSLFGTPAISRTVATGRKKIYFLRSRPFYRSTHVVQSAVSRPSVRPSVTLTYRGHTGWTSSKLITRIINQLRVFAPRSHKFGDLVCVPTTYILLLKITYLFLLIAYYKSYHLNLTHLRLDFHIILNKYERYYGPGWECA